MLKKNGAKVLETASMCILKSPRIKAGALEILTTSQKLKSRNESSLGQLQILLH